MKIFNIIMKFHELTKTIKEEIVKLEKLFIILNNEQLFVEDSKLIIKIIIITYIRILNKNRNKYLIHKINFLNIQKRIEKECMISKYRSIKMIYNRIFYINGLILKNYYKFEEIKKIKKKDRYNEHN